MKSHILFNNVDIQSLYKDTSEQNLKILQIFELLIIIKINEHSPGIINFTVKSGSLRQTQRTPVTA